MRRLQGVWECFKRYKDACYDEGGIFLLKCFLNIYVGSLTTNRGQ